MQPESDIGRGIGRGRGRGRVRQRWIIIFYIRLFAKYRIHFEVTREM